MVAGALQFAAVRGQLPAAPEDFPLFQLQPVRRGVEAGVQRVRPVQRFDTAMLLQRHSPSVAGKGHCRTKLQGGVNIDR